MASAVLQNMITGQEALPLEAGAIPQLAQGIRWEPHPASRAHDGYIHTVALRGNGRAGEHQFTLLQPPQSLTVARPGTQKVLGASITLDSAGATWCRRSPSFNHRDLLALLLSSAQLSTHFQSAGSGVSPAGDKPGSSSYLSPGNMELTLGVAMTPLAVASRHIT